MAAERLCMRNIRNVYRLHFVEQKSQSEISMSTNCGKTTVREYLQRARAAGFTNYQEIEILSDEILMERLGFKRLGEIGVQPLRRLDLVMPTWSDVHTEYCKPSVTLALLWTEYREQQGLERSYGYTQFCEHYKRWNKKLSVVMRQTHKAGEKSFVDYCDGLWLIDAAAGTKRRTQLFVGCLGASSYTFAEATMSQTLPDWISSHCKMWSFFGGVTEILVPDNLKSGVTKPDRYEALINETYQDMAAHYGTCVIPARPVHPRDKAKVEANVLVAQRWILARLRNRIFNSLNEMNIAIYECLEFLNNRKMRLVQKSRYEIYIELEQGLLKPLPVKAYEFAQWKDARVNIDYHVTIDFHHYSVPYQLVHELMNVRMTSTVIEIFYRGKRVASHRRSSYKGKPTTLPEHMPKSHREYAEWTPSRIISWAESLGSNTGLLVKKVIEQRKHPEQGFRSAMGIIRLEKKYGKDRLEKSCGRALELGATSYQFVSQMLKNRMDFPERDCDSTQVPSSFDPQTNEEQLALLGAENIRGSKYYH